MDPRGMVVLAAVAAAGALQGRIGDANAERRANDFRYAPDPKMAKLLAGSHRSALADMIWLRALPDMARPFNDREMKRRWLISATDAVTELEPTFGTVYGFGADHLSLDQDEHSVDAAVALLEKGARENPDCAGMHIKLAMEYWQYKKDRAKAIASLEKASVLPGCDSLSMAMLASLKVKGREDLPALYCWAKALEDTPPGRAHVTVEYELWRTKQMIAQRAMKEFQATHGSPPTSLEDLRDPRLMEATVVDLVLEGLEIVDGKPHYARLEELNHTRLSMQADEWAAEFHGEQGRFPTEAEFWGWFGKEPVAPAGKAWRYAEGKLTLVAQ